MVLENLPEDDDSLNLKNVSITNKAMEKEEIREGAETSKQNAVDINLPSIRSELVQNNKHLISKLATSSPILTIDSSSAMNHSDFQASDVRDEIFNAQDKGISFNMGRIGEHT